MIKFIKKYRYRLIAAAAVIAAVSVLLLLFYKQKIKLNTPDEEEYPVRGIDVSSYQGSIDWQTLSEGLDFAFIKATEGSVHCDENFAFNYAEAQKTGLRVGAYHFFSFDSGGDSQAENFISNVEPYDGMLPPVVDVEFYGEYRSEPKSAEEVVPELTVFIEKIEEYYGVKPIIYATGSAYTMYIEENFPDNDIWLRSVYFNPDRDWTFWQYSSVGRLDGYNGEEKYIDLNVFNGSEEEFESYGCNK